MQSDPQAPPTEASEPFLPRKLEMEALAELLPMRGVEPSSKRVINVWGEARVGKSAFISAFRESELMHRSKILWIQPTRDERPDTIPEFIRACSKTLRYPADPAKEEKIANQLESVQRGKVNPIVSDDSILITRTSIANNKKPYINQAAASSVGRTETARDEVQISVGLGESKATNHAEGFLDALPLQSLGTDLTIIYLQRLDELSVTIVDWLRDYVIPAATRGAYRRSVVFLIESLDPLKLAYPHESFGEWSELTCDFRLYPLSEDDAFRSALAAGADPDSARFLVATTLGYPLALRDALAACKRGAFGPRTLASRQPLLDPLQAEELERLGALSLPGDLQSDELDALFGPGGGKPALEWLKRFAGTQLQRSASGLSLPADLRHAAIVEVGDSARFQEMRSRWNALGKLVANVRDRLDRSKLLLLSGLNWMDADSCRELFGDQSEAVLAFVESRPNYFNRHSDRFRISERILGPLEKVAKLLHHKGAAETREKAATLWQSRSEAAREEIARIEAELLKLQVEINTLARRQSEALAQIRIHDRASGAGAPLSKVATSANSGAATLLSALLALACFGAGSVLDYPVSAVLYALGLVAFTVGIVYLTKWLAGRGSARPTAGAGDAVSLRRQSAEIAQRVQDHESQMDELKAQLSAAKAELRYSLVRD